MIFLFEILSKIFFWRKVNTSFLPNSIVLCIIQAKFVRFLITASKSTVASEVLINPLTNWLIEVSDILSVLQILIAVNVSLPLNFDSKSLNLDEFDNSSRSFTASRSVADDVSLRLWNKKESDNFRDDSGIIATLAFWLRRDTTFDKDWERLTHDSISIFYIFKLLNILLFVSTF